MADPCTLPEADPKLNRFATSPAIPIPLFLGVMDLAGEGEGPNIFRFAFSGDFAFWADEVVGRANEGVDEEGRVMVR